VRQRAGGVCELCGSLQETGVYAVPPVTERSSERMILACGRCRAQLEKREEPDAAHWRCLESSMWSEVEAVKVVAWRMLQRFRSEGWASEALDMLFLDEPVEAWARESGDHLEESAHAMHRDSNGAILQNGDTVVLTNSLDVKGSSVNARAATVIKGIRLVPDNYEQVEGRIEGQMIVVLTKYVRRG